MEFDRKDNGLYESYVGNTEGEDFFMIIFYQLYTL